MMTNPIYHKFMFACIRQAGFLVAMLSASCSPVLQSAPSATRTFQAIVISFLPDYDWERQDGRVIDLSTELQIPSE